MALSDRKIDGLSQKSMAFFGHYLNISIGCLSPTQDPSTVRSPEIFNAESLWEKAAWVPGQCGTTVSNFIW